VIATRFYAILNFLFIGFLFFGSWILDFGSCVKKLSADKPDSVYPDASVRTRLSFIWSRHYCRDLAAYPPALPTNKCCIGRAALNDWYTWHFSMQGLPVPTVTSWDRELLPHVFTITRSAFAEAMADKAVIFCGPVCFPHCCGSPAVSRCIALCCPDFPPHIKCEAIAWLIVRLQI